jgi:hypothetical protein
LSADGGHIPDGFAYRGTETQIMKRFHELFPKEPFVELDRAYDQLIEREALGGYVGLEAGDGLLLRWRV